MKVYIGMVLLFLSIVGCSTKQKGNEFLRGQKTEPIKELKLNSPAVFLGTTFGQFIQVSHKIGDYQKMLEFTSSETRKKFGDSTLLEYYSTMEFSSPIKLRTLKREGDKYTLIYSTSINATQKTIYVEGVIENDSCKLVLDFLNSEKPFSGI